MASLFCWVSGYLCKPSRETSNNRRLFSKVQVRKWVWNWGTEESMTANNKRPNIRISSCIDEKNKGQRGFKVLCQFHTAYWNRAGIPTRACVLAILTSQYLYFLSFCLLTCFSTGDWSWAWVWCTLDRCSTTESLIEPLVPTTSRVKLIRCH